MKTLADQPANDRRRRVATLDDVIADTSVLPVFCKGSCIVFIISPRRPRSRKRRSASNPTIHSAGAGRCREPHLFEFLQPTEPSNSEAHRLRKLPASAEDRSSLLIPTQIAIDSEN